MQVEWSVIKAFLTARGLSAQFINLGTNYWIKAIDGSFGIECLITTDPTNSDTADFLANFITNGNKPLCQNTTISSTPAFASKTFGSKSLFKRVRGLQSVVAIGDNTILYVEEFSWVKFMALEIINGEIGDYVSLYILDTVTGTYTGHANYQLNQFGYNANIGAGFYEHKSEFDADIYQGLQIKIVYHSISAKTVGINYIMNEVK